MFGNMHNSADHHLDVITLLLFQQTCAAKVSIHQLFNLMRPGLPLKTGRNLLNEYLKSFLVLGSFFISKTKDDNWKKKCHSAL